jgi:hypothetical protein
MEFVKEAARGPGADGSGYGASGATGWIRAGGGDPARRNLPRGRVLVGPARWARAAGRSAGDESDESDESEYGAVDDPVRKPVRDPTHDSGNDGDE